MKWGWLNMDIRLAEARDLDGVIALIAERIAWMDAVGIKQWNRTGYFTRYPRAYFLSLTEKKELFVAEDESGIAGVMALFSEDERWPDDGVPALYVHHLAAALRCRGLGRKLLAWAECYAAGAGKERLRLDSAVGNEKLEYFYAAQGYLEAGFCDDGPYHGVLREKRLDAEVKSK